MKLVKVIFFILTSVILFLPRVQASQQKCINGASFNGVTITGAWARVSTGRNSAVFCRLFLSKPAHKAISLIRAESPVAQTIELHTHIKEGDIFRMRPIQEILLPLHQEVLLKSGGLHIMLINLHQTLKEGDSISLTLHFSDQSHCTINVPVMIRAPG